MADLTTLAAVKNWLAIPPAQTQSDDAISALVTSISADFLRAIERSDFLAATYTEIREGDGGPRLSTRHWPINTITSLTVSGAALAVSPDGVAAGYYLDEATDAERLAHIFLTAGGVFTDGAPIVLTYNAGYAAAPNDVSQAVAEWVALRWKTRPSTGLTSQREAGGEHATYEKDEAMPANTARVIEKYKRTWPSLNKRQDDLDQRVTRINRTFTEVSR